MQATVFWIDGLAHGRLGIVPRPRGGDWLEDELLSWRNEGVDVVVSLLERHEELELGLTDEAALSAQMFSYYSSPVPDLDVPRDREKFLLVVAKVVSHLSEGKSVIVHCRQSVGRSGLFAAAVMLLLGFSLDDALQRIARARGCTVPETDAQMVWLKALAYDVESSGRKEA